MAEPEPENTSNNKSKITKREQQWLYHIKLWQVSDLSLAGYARSQGLVAKTFYNWHVRLKRRGLIPDEPVNTVFHRVTVKPPEMPSALVQRRKLLTAPNPQATNEMSVIRNAVLTLRFKLPNGIDGELTGTNLGNCADFLEALARLRL